MRRTFRGLMTVSFALSGVLSCATAAPDVPPAQPKPEAAPDPAAENRFVSTDHAGEIRRGRVAMEGDQAPQFDGTYAVTSADEARERAEAAVADRLDPSRSWRTSPALPTAWPAKDKAVMFLFYPMAASETKLSSFVLYSAAFRVEVSLVDGTTSVQALGKPRKLGGIVETRAATLERSELEIAERALIHRLLGAVAHHGENGFWGYLKYFHEHQQIARDIKVRAPKFTAWLQRGR